MELHLHEEKHPNKAAREALTDLVGLGGHAATLTAELTSILDPTRVAGWAKRHHAGRLRIAQRLRGRTPLVLLSGEVGCGKSALARAIGTPVADALDEQVLVFETPSDLRGSGMVGEISARITGAFAFARGRANGKPALLLLDEADDIATSRGQLQAHHEDRAGLNVLLRQIDLVARERTPMAVVLITNRESVLDPAIRRRVALHLRFERPDAAARAAMFDWILRDVPHHPRDIEALVHATGSRGVPYSSGDIFERLTNEALRTCWHADVPFTPAALLAALARVDPSPLIEPVAP